MNKNTEIKQEVEKYFTEENETDHMIIETNNRREVLSPSKRFKLVISYYKTRKGCWNYSRGIVYRTSDGEEICDIKRNYSSFHYSFVTKNDQEYLITGRSYMSQTIVNLDTGEEFEPTGDQYKSNAFCWATCYLSPDGNTLIVDGCVWAGPYEYRFYDFTDPSKGWPELRIGDDDYIIADKKRPVFNKDETITCYQTQEYYLPLSKYEYEIPYEDVESIPDEEYNDPNNWEDVENIRLTLKREGDSMRIIERWVSDDEKKRIERRKITNQKYKEWLENFKTTDPLYLEYEKLIKTSGLPVEKHSSQGITFKGWAPNFNKTEKRWCRRIVTKSDNGYVIDLNWAVETGPIKLIIYKDGKKGQDLFFKHSVSGMQEAFAKAVALTTGS